MLIPKTLHYVWLGQKPMHPLMQDWQKKWGVLHPGWEIKVWKEAPDLPPYFLVCNDQIIECRCPEFLAKCPTYAKKSDVWRYEILEQLGGVYLDTDFEPVKNIEPVIKESLAFAGTCNTRYNWSDDCPEGKIKIEVACSIMGCVPHHLWLRDLVMLTPMQDSQAQLSLAFPFLTSVTMRHPDVTLFPPNVFYAVSWDEYALGGRQQLVKKPLPPEAVAVHRWSSNWFSEGLKKRV